MIKVSFVLLIALGGGLAGCVGLPLHADASGVTELEIQEYKFGLVKGCTDQSRDRGESSDIAKGECGCALHVLEASLTHEEWQAITYGAQTRRNYAEAKILSRYEQQFKECHRAA